MSDNNINTRNVHVKDGLTMTTFDYWDIRDRKNVIVFDPNRAKDRQWGIAIPHMAIPYQDIETVARWAVASGMPDLSASDAWAEYDELLARHKQPPQPKFDALAFIIQCETEGFEDEADIIYGLNRLKDSGLLFQLQGSWQRMARAYGVI